MGRPQLIIAVNAQLDGPRAFLKVAKGQLILMYDGIQKKVEDIKITCPIADFARFPLGTVFIATKVLFPESDHLHIEKESAKQTKHETKMKSTEPKRQMRQALQK